MSIEQTSECIANVVDDPTPQLGGDLDGQGNYLVDVQNISDLNASGQGYWSDGINDSIIIPDDDNLSFTIGGFSCIASIKPQDATSFLILSKGTGNELEYLFLINSSDKLEVEFTIPDESGYIGRRYDTALTSRENLNIEVGFTFDGGTVPSGIKLFLNGAQIDDVNVQFGTFTGMVNNTKSVYLGRLWETGIYGEGHRSRMLLFSLELTETEMKALSSGAPVPYKYIGANSDEQVINGTFDADTDWNKQNGSTIAGGIANVIAAGTISSTTSHHVLTQNSVFDVWKAHRITFKVRQTVGTGNFQMGNGYNVLFNQAVTGSFVTYTVETVVPFKNFLANSQQIVFGGLTSTDEFELDDVTVTQIGCVLQLEQSGIGHSQWLDNSGNELHGAVSGVIPTNLPADDVERFRHTVAITDDTTWTDVVPAGYELEKIIFVESAGNAATIDLGTVATGSDVFKNQVIAASSITTVAINKTFSMTVAQSLFLNDDDAGSAWNSASLTATLLMRKVV